MSREPEPMTFKPVETEEGWKVTQSAIGYNGGWNWIVEHTSKIIPAPIGVKDHALAQRIARLLNEYDRRGSTSGHEPKSPPTPIDAMMPTDDKTRIT